MLTVRAAHCAPTHISRHETAWELLYTAIEEEYGIPREALTFARNENGKPVCTSHPYIWFSITHGTDCAAIALSDAPVGIDCEKLRSVPPRVRSRVLGLEEEGDGEEALVRWCEMESYAKYRGGVVFGMQYGETMEEAREECVFTRSDALGEGCVLILCTPK